MLLLHLAMHLFVILLVPPLLLGVINQTKARFAGRRGQPLLQPYFDLLRLFRKGMVLSRTTTWVFRAGPVVGLATALVAALLLPLGGPAGPITFEGDLILLCYVLGLGRFFTVLAALDTGSAFEGMGASREATFSALAEPALFLGLLAFVRRTGELSLSGMFSSPQSVLWSAAGAPLLLVAASLLILLLAENSRVPFDDPNTHLELTMVHEVMVLDHSGPAFGLILYGASIKLFVFAALLVRIIVPFAWLPGWAGWPVLIVASLVVAIVVGVIESAIARLRLLQVPRLLISAALLSGFGLVLAVR